MTMLWRPHYQHCKEYHVGETERNSLCSVLWAILPILTSNSEGENGIKNAYTNNMTLTIIWSSGKYKVFRRTRYSACSSLLWLMSYFKTEAMQRTNPTCHLESYAVLVIFWLYDPFLQEIINTRGSTVRSLHKSIRISAPGKWNQYTEWSTSQTFECPNGKW